MAVVGPIVVISILFAFSRKGRAAKKRAESEKLSAVEKNSIEAEHKQKLQETDELITKILPVINSDK